MRKISRHAAGSLALILAAPACAHEGHSESVTITDFAGGEHESAASAARYEIVIHSGAGIPGTPGANDYYRKPKQVLQAIVDTCQLGKTLYRQATDGVSILYIVDTALSEGQVACIRSAEATGLSLTDRGAN